MAGQVFEEVLRLVLETQGREGLDALLKSLDGVSDASDATVDEARKLTQQLVELNAAAARAARFEQLTSDLEATTAALDHASREAIQLNLELAETDKPSKQAQRAYQQLREEVSKLEAKQKSQTALQEKLGAELRAAGVDTTKLATANQSLRTRIDDTTAALKRQAQTVEQEVVATRKQRDALADADEAFRKFVASGDASAAALKRVKAGAEGAAAGSRELANEGGRLRGVFDGLRGLIAPVLAYLSFSTAIQGIKNLAGVGAAAENARRSLQNLYGGVEAGNAAYAGLRDMAKQNGIAFNDLVDTAKRLKAFGLDPLNGSLQALIDQNAAVGGSMQDLDGKVLALGQAWAKQKLQGEEILQLVERGVPVWDLLQKSTGKNVQELQKLSEQGKLGRDVIRGLYEELGRANTGAAERGLSSLSGLVAQVTARWEAFLQKVADSGVTDYFKLQMQSLLGSTGDFDSLAKRVADGIIGFLEALKSLGGQLAPIAAAVGNLTLFLARHAEAVANAVKAWALFRAIQLTAGFGRLTQSIIGATTALVAQNAALAASANSGAAVGSLSGLYAALSARIAAAATAALNLVRLLGIPAAVTAGVYALSKAYEGVVEANNRLWLSEAQLRSQQQDQLRMGQQLQQLYKDSANVAIQSGSAVSKMTRDQAADYKLALEQARLYYRGVVDEAVAAGDAVKLAGAKEEIAALGDAIGGVTARLEELKKSADPRGLRAFVDTAVGKFDELVTKSKDAKQAISGIFDGVDFRTADGIRQASDILTQITARGTDAGRAIKTELSAALAKVAVEDLPKLKMQADAAMAAGVVGARQFSDAIASVNLSRLGVDINAIKTGFTEAGKSAVEAFRGAVAEVDALGLTVEQRSEAIAQAFDNAFKQASTKAELAALKASLQDALSSGDIGFADFQVRLAETDEKLRDLSSSGKKLGSDISSGVSQASSALGGLGSAATDAERGLSGAEKAAGGANKEAEEGTGLIQGYALAWDGLNDSAALALQSLNKYLITGVTGAPLTQYKMRVERLSNEMDRQLRIVRELTEAAKQQNAVYDENEQRLIALRQQYKWIADSELQALIDAENRLRDNRARAAEEAQQQAQARAEDAAAAAEAAREAEALAASTALTGRSGASNVSAQATVQAAAQVVESAVAAASELGEAASRVSTSELILRVVVEPNQQGQAVILSKQQMDDIVAAMVRTLSLSKNSST